MWDLLHKVFHCYIYTSKKGDLDVYGINQCMEMIRRDALLNAESYVYYAASKLDGPKISPSRFTADIRLKCINSPTARTRPLGQDGAIYVLESEGIQAAFAADENLALVVENRSVVTEAPVQFPARVDPKLTARALKKHGILHG